MSRIQPQQFYRLPEAARLLPSERTSGSIHPQTLRQLIRSGRIRATRRPGGRFWWIRGSELLRYLTERGTPAMRTPTSVLAELAALGVRAAKEELERATSS